MKAPLTLSTGCVASVDGTVVGYEQLGSGPGLILVHDGLMSAEHLLQLGAKLSDDFTVYIPDRRGRGSSGAYGDNYGIERDCEDLRTLAQQTGTDRIFGLGTGAIIALETALRAPELTRVAAYEPPYSIAGRDNAEWLPRFDAEVARGKLGRAMVTALRGMGHARWPELAPRWLLGALLELALAIEGFFAQPGDTLLRELIPTMHYDALLVRETTPTVARLRELRARVALLGGNLSAAFLNKGLDALQQFVPSAERILLLGVGHTAAANDKRPEVVAHVLRTFFA